MVPCVQCYHVIFGRRLDVPGPEHHNVPEHRHLHELLCGQAHERHRSCRPHVPVAHKCKYRAVAAYGEGGGQRAKNRVRCTVPIEIYIYIKTSGYARPVAYFFQRGDPGSWSAALHRTPEFMMRPCDKGRHEGLEARHGLATGKGGRQRVYSYTCPVLAAHLQPLTSVKIPCGW